jgi:NAD+ kinase
MTTENLALAFICADNPDAREAAARLAALYGQSSLADADVVVALGGDGFMLQAIHENMDSGRSIYGMNRGTVGFLMNEYAEAGLRERILAAGAETIRPLVMEAQIAGGGTVSARAINEVSLFRQSAQAAKVRISIDGKMRLDELVCDGVMVATPAGSTAYNLSAHGPILPLDAPLLALTPVSPFRPRRWRGALIPNRSVVRRHRRGRQAPGQRRRRPCRGQVRHQRQRARVAQLDGDAAVRRQSFLGRAHPHRTVPLLNRAPISTIKGLKSAQMRPFGGYPVDNAASAP